MQITASLASALVVAMYGSSVLANPMIVTDDHVKRGADADASTGKSAPHSAKGAAVVNPAQPDLVSSPAAGGQKCITFTSSVSNTIGSQVYWKNAGVWGSNSGTFGSGGATICVPTTNQAGGAMFIGPESNDIAGNTKLECYFPTSGTANCDVSLVDGYGLSVACSVANTPLIGGNINLYNTGIKCSDTSLVYYGVCKNDAGPTASSQSQVDAFFQPATQNGNNYCIWDNCSQDYYFPVTAAITCHVSGT